MNVFRHDIVIVGGGGAGLRAAIEAAENHPNASIALVSKVYPMRSHTVSAEGGAAAVAREDDNLELHGFDTVKGSDFLGDQDCIVYFVEQAPKELALLENWGCPFSRNEDGTVATRAFGGMTTKRTWYAADKIGFHMLHALFQHSMRFKNIVRYDEYFVSKLLVDGGACGGVAALDIRTGEYCSILGRGVILTTGGGGKIFPFTTNGTIKTADGMALAYRAGVPLKDMEFVQYHPTGLPNTGSLLTEACRGEGGLLLNKDGYRYLQDYGLGPATPKPVNKAMELGPRDRLSQAFWYEQQKGRTLEGVHGSYVHLDLRHLGEAYLRERLPQIYEMAEEFLGIDPAKTPIPVRPAVHYTMGGIEVNGRCASPLKGLYAAGECASVGIHGANRLGSNSLAELGVFGKVAGEEAARFAREHPSAAAGIEAQASAVEKRVRGMVPNGKGGSKGSERIATLRKEMAASMENGCGIYRTAEAMQATCDKLAELKDRFAHIRLDDTSSVFNTEWLAAIELDYQLDVARTMAHSALLRRESRGAHQRLDGFDKRDDVNFLCHSLANYREGAAPQITTMPVTITRSPPGQRAYGALGEQLEAARKDGAHA